MRKPVGIKAAGVLLGIFALGGALVALQVSIHKPNPKIVKASRAVTVDYGTKKQIVRGFGGSTAWLGPLTSQQRHVYLWPAGAEHHDVRAASGSSLTCKFCELGTRVPAYIGSGHRRRPQGLLGAIVCNFVNYFVGR